MKIHELEQMSGVKAETIRMYREKGLLHPTKLPNGYYDYSLNQFRELMNIRKLRGAGLGLDLIEYYGTHDNIQEIVEALQQENQDLLNQIDALRKQQYMLQVTLRHFVLYMENGDQVAELEVDDDSYSLVVTESPGELQRKWFCEIPLMTQSVLIPREVLLAKELPQNVPYSMGVGTYGKILRQNGVKIPPQAVTIPKGKYLTCWINVEDEKTIPREQIQPILDYAESHHYTLTGDSTAFLYRVDRTGTVPRFVYRFRARVF